MPAAPASVDTNPSPGKHGGARPGAGRKPKSNGDANDPYLLLARAKAKKETFLAHQEELKFRRAAGQLYDRDQVLQVFTTTIATFAEQMRSVPDMLERKAGLTPKQAEMTADEIDTQLEELRRRLMQVFADGHVG
jgi:hypothetical protein